MREHATKEDQCPTTVTLTLYADTPTLFMVGSCDKPFRTPPSRPA
ncbi:hypothetical protein BSIN_0269 [Burkholderia singularis]|uniref:Uncharacterized protein n=1 Tax=Burkholderia singularis TaxID=1503053 RepID=A0A238H4G8_9BURK|nr:hypothetical protein BSIN_0269 [Burkholderia singularis]